MPSNEFLESPVNYKPDTALITPYLKAKLEWDDRLGSLVKRTKNWRLVAILCLCLSLTLSIGLVGFSLKSKYIPVVLEVDETGRVENKGIVSSFVAGEKEIKFFLVEFIKKVRGISQDPVLIKKNWQEAYKFLKTESINKLNEIAQNEQSLNLIGKITVAVEPISVVKIGDSDNYQVRWKEIVFDDSGNKNQENILNGVFSVAVEKVGNEAIFVNPFGIYIRNFSWSRELSGD